MERSNISDIHNCYGCGMCSKPCPVHIIDLHLNKNGFYEPYLTDPSKCIHCGLCRKVCAYIKNDLAVDNKPIASYAAWSNDQLVRSRCSSGGVGFEIARYLVGKGFTTVGVRYIPEKQRAEHFVASTPEEVDQTSGSKYIQSYTIDGWKDIDNKGKYLVTGTPCQIDSFRNYLKQKRLPEENFVLLDFYCHGVPSMNVWKKYSKSVEKKIGKFTYVSWRNKWIGTQDGCTMKMRGEEHVKKINWHDSYNFFIKGVKGSWQSRMSKGDKFYKLFLGDCALGPQCYYRCKYKYDKSSADIRICDLWGKTYQDYADGVSGSIAFTERGKEILNAINCHLTVQPFEIVAQGQMRACPSYKHWYKKVEDVLADQSASINDAIKIVDHERKIDQWKYRFRHPVPTVCKIIKKI
mgnify:FL=1